MNQIRFLFTLLAETLGSPNLEREPEGSLVMDDADQVADYDKAGRVDGLMAASYLFHSARVSQVIQGSRNVVDLGCGPAIQLCQIATLNPGTSFLGVDLSSNMLEKARENARTLGLQNVDFAQGDITELKSLGDASADAVISTMALHHLPTFDDLRRCFREIRRILRPNGALYLVDFGRLRRVETVRYFVGLNVAEQPPLFNLDYERSLRAAFSKREFKSAADAELPEHIALLSTFLVPMLTLLKSADRPVDKPLRDRLRRMAMEMPKRYRRDLDEIRTFFRLGGLKNDLFSS